MFFLEGGGGKWGEAVPRERALLHSISQEHGILRVRDRPTFEAIEVGGLLGILPVHSCLTADAMRSYTVVGGKEEKEMLLATTYEHAEAA